MYSINITRVRPNTEVKFLSKKPESDQVYYRSNYKDTTTFTDSMSDDGLTLTIIRSSDRKEVLESFKNEFGNTSSPMYVRTQYDLDNGIVTTFSDIKSLGVDDYIIV
jgi:hypothetical protein